MLTLPEPRRGLVAALAFMLPFLSLSTLWGVSVSGFLFLLVALAQFKACREAIATHWQAVRWVLAAFLVNFLFAFFCLLAQPGTTPAILEKPLRMLLACAALALVAAFRPQRSALWWGVAGGALGGTLLVGYQRLGLGMDRPGGLLNAITAGDLLVCFALMSVAAALDRRAHRHALWLALGALAGLAGALMTGTRGGLVALVPAAFVLGRSGPRARRLALAGLALVAIGYAIPQSGAQARLTQGIRDVQSWHAGGSAYTNMGIRMELWKAAAGLIAQRPVSGRSMAEARDAMAQRVAAGSLDPVVLPAPHFHNDALQAMVTGGVAGLLAWLAILAAPLVFFARRMRQSDGGILAPALAGLLLVTSYLCFGLTEVIFWSVKASLLYALMVFMLMGLCLNAKELDGK